MQKSENNLLSWENFCPFCKNYQPEYGVCQTIHENVRSYPKRFFEKCSGNYFVQNEEKSIVNQDDIIKVLKLKVEAYSKENQPKEKRYIGRFLTIALFAALIIIISIIVFKYKSEYSIKKLFYTDVKKEQLKSISVNDGNIDLSWGRTPKIEYEEFVVEYISVCPGEQPDISKKKETKPFIKNEIPAFLIDGEFYGDLAWLEQPPTEINYGLVMMFTYTGSAMVSDGTYGKVHIKSNSVFTMKPAFPNNASSTYVKISGKVEFLFHPSTMGSKAAFLPLFFINGTKATLLLMKGEQITFKQTPILAEEYTEIELTFDVNGKVKSNIKKGKIREL